MFTTHDVFHRLWRDRPAWHDDAACRNHPQPNIWFKATSHKHRDRIDADTARAIAICKACPVRVECLEYAVENHEVWGVWGATLEVDRRVMWRRRQATIGGVA